MQSFLKQFIKHFVLTVAIILVISPFFWMFSTSFKTFQEIQSVPPTIFPKLPTFENYIELLKNWPIALYFLNSFVVTGVSTVICLFISAIGGYVFAKLEFPAKKVLFFLILATIMVPFQTYMIVLYLFTIKLNWVDTFKGIIYPFVISTFGIFFMRQNISSIPDDLLDSARIDGASEFRIFLSVIIPLSTAALSALTIFLFMARWILFIWPLVITNSPEKYVLEVGLASLQQSFFIHYGILMAGSMMAIIPVVIIFLIFRRRIIRGVVMSGFKY